jgi:hypothetical protein
VDAASSYDSLSPGGREIVEALFAAQSSGGEGQMGESWSLDRIAAVKADGQGWGRVFKEMKAEGLLSARNLGEVVSGRHRSLASRRKARRIDPGAGSMPAGGGLARPRGKAERSSLPGKSRLQKPTDIVITTASGRQVGVRLGKNRRPPSAGQASRRYGYAKVRARRARGLSHLGGSAGGSYGVRGGASLSRAGGKVKARGRFR